MIDDDSLKIQSILSKLGTSDNIRSILQANHKNKYLSLKNNHLFSQKLRFSCLSPAEHDILYMIDDNSLKTEDIRTKLIIAFV